MTGWPKLNDDDPPPSLQLHYRAFITTTRQSAPHQRIGTFGLAVVAACAFSLKGTSKNTISTGGHVANQIQSCNGI